MNARIAGAFLMCALSPEVFAQASIATENIIDDVAFEYIDALNTKQTVHISLVRDARKEDQWYYIPSSPTLTTTKSGNDTVPQFSLLQYDFKDADNPATIKRSGILNFAVRLALPPEAIGKAKEAAAAQVRGRFGDRAASALRLSALPINSATVSVYSDDRLVASAEGTGIAPTFASQQMAFSLSLNEVGSAVFEELVNSPTGIRTAVQYSYNGLTPPAGFKVKLNYRNAFKHYSENTEFRARASYYGLFSASYSRSTAEIREELISSGAMTVEVTTDKDFTIDKIDRYLQPILKRLNDEILEYTKPPEAIDPAKAASPSAGGYFGGAGYSVATKSVEKIRQIEEVIDFTHQSIVERNTVASGFIGIGNYPEKIRNQVFQKVDGTRFPAVYATFPEVPEGISRVELKVALVVRDEVLGSENFSFRRDRGWIDLRNGREADRIGLSLARAEQKFGEKAAEEEVMLRITKVLLASGDRVEATSDVSVDLGAAHLELEHGLTAIRLRGNKVSFKELGGDVVRVEVRVQAGHKTKHFTFEAEKQNADWNPPIDEMFLIEAMSGLSKVDLEITVVRVDEQYKRSSSTTSHEIALAPGITDVHLDDFVGGAP
jgi:hypothetical protein